MGEEESRSESSWSRSGLTDLRPSILEGAALSDMAGRERERKNGEAVASRRLREGAGLCERPGSDEGVFVGFW
jgi:hypothetical protein